VVVEAVRLLDAQSERRQAAQSAKESAAHGVAAAVAAASASGAMVPDADTLLQKLKSIAVIPLYAVLP
jgi:hypothetical protein